MLILICFGVLYMILVLVQMYSFMQAHEKSLTAKERELLERERALDATEQWLDNRYDRLERITNRQYK